MHTIASTAFDQTGVNVTADGRPYLGSPTGSPSYVETFVKSKVSTWSSLVTSLADIATTPPHAAYSALNHGLSSKWTYMCRTTPITSHLMKPLDESLRTHLIPSFTGNPPPNEIETALLALYQQGKEDLEFLYHPSRPHTNTAPPNKLHLPVVTAL